MITPLHMIAATPVKFIFPKHFSLLWFSIVNVLIDIEVLYYIIIAAWPIHRFFHTLLGVSIVGFGCFILSLLFTKNRISSFTGCIIGAYSHYLIDYWYHNGFNYS